ncbi:MAG: O-antigen polymerase [Patescibacteria group bacterium]
MILAIVFAIIGAAFGSIYFFGPEKFSFEHLLFSLWALAVSLAQLRLSPYEEPFTNKFWLVLICFFVLFYLIYKVTKEYFSKRFKDEGKEWGINGWLAMIALSVLTLLSLGANYYIFNRFGTLPILSTIPDKMRFIINREVFGLWEYASLLPRIFIPLAFIYLAISKIQWWKRLFLVSDIVLGFFLLSLYASRLIIVITILLCFFSYLIISLKKISFKKTILSALIAVISVLTVSVSIPAVRQYITYKDYYSDIEYTPFTYLADLSQIKVPERYNFLIPLYLIPSFNLQAMMRATDFFSFTENRFYFGTYSLSALDPALKLVHLKEFDVIIPWKAMFLPWWVTATFLFNFWADFGYLGIVLAAVFLGLILGFSYSWATKKTSLGSVMLFAYLSFVVVMSIYTNYFMRPEMYLDLVLILILGLAMGNQERVFPTTE